MQPAEERPSTDSIVKEFTRIALPTTWGLIAVTIVSAADTAFVGAIGPNALAAIGIVIPFVMMVSNANIGIVNSLTPLFAAQEKHHSAVRLALRATTLLLTINTLLIFPGLVWGHAFFKAQAPNVKVLQYCTEYWNTALLGILILIPLLVVSILLRTRDQAKESGTLFTISALVNFSADFLLVQGNVGFPALGVQGSAFATNIGWMIGLVYGIWVLFKQGIWCFSFTMFQPLQTLRECLSILYFGIPGAISQSALPFSSALIIGTVTRNGALEVAAFMIATGIESILMIVGIGVSTALCIIVSKAKARNDIKAINLAIRIAIQFALLWGVASWLFTLQAGESVVRIFTKETTLVSLSTFTFQIMTLSMVGRVAVLMGAGTLTSLGFPVEGSILTLGSAFLVTVPAVMLGSSIRGLSGIMYSLLFSGLISWLISHVWIRYRIHTVDRAII